MHYQLSIINYQLSIINYIYAFGTETSFMPDEGAVEVAFTRIITVMAELPNTLRDRLVVVMAVQVAPPFRLYSILLETPIILF